MRRILRLKFSIRYDHFEIFQSQMYTIDNCVKMHIFIILIISDVIKQLLLFSNN